MSSLVTKLISYTFSNPISSSRYDYHLIFEYMLHAIPIFNKLKTKIKTKRTRNATLMSDSFKESTEYLRDYLKDVKIHIIITTFASRQ